MKKNKFYFLVLFFFFGFGRGWGDAQKLAESVEISEKSDDSESATLPKTPEEVFVLARKLNWLVNGATLRNIRDKKLAPAVLQAAQEKWNIAKSNSAEAFNIAILIDVLGNLQYEPAIPFLLELLKADDKVYSRDEEYRWSEEQNRDFFYLSISNALAKIAKVVKGKKHKKLLRKVNQFAKNNRIMDLREFNPDEVREAVLEVEYKDVLYDLSIGILKSPEDAGMAVYTIGKMKDLALHYPDTKKRSKINDELSMAINNSSAPIVDADFMVAWIEFALKDKDASTLNAIRNCLEKIQNQLGIAVPDKSTKSDLSDKDRLGVALNAFKKNALKN